MNEYTCRYDICPYGVPSAFCNLSYCSRHGELIIREKMEEIESKKVRE